MAELLGFMAARNPDIIARISRRRIVMTPSSPAPTLVQLVFFGEIAAGHAPAEAKRKLAAALGIAPERIEQVFSGSRVVLKQSLPADEAPRYLAKLERIGILARAEPQLDAAPGTPPAPVDHAARIETSAAAEEIACPKCGTRQPKRTLCLSCSTDMPRFAAAQKLRQDEERAVRIAALKGAASPARDLAETDYAIEGPGLFGASFEGRIGRLSYLVGLFAIGAACFGAAVAVGTSGLWLLLVPILLGALFLGLRLAALRCHDIGSSGWWSLVSLVPYAGSLFSLILAIVPGTRGDNEFGRASRPPGAAALASSLLVLVVAGVLASNQIGKLAPRPADFRVQDSPTTAESVTRIGDYDPKNNTVVMYSLTTCGYCVKKRRELDEMGIRYTELFTDLDDSAHEQLSARIERAGLPNQSYGTPILEVNGVLLPNNPPMNEIVRHLRGRPS